jgi:hypothetical protein
MQPQMLGLIRKSVIFFENMDHNHGQSFASPTPLATVEFGHFGILTDCRPVRLPGRALAYGAFESSGTMVSKDEVLRRVWQGRIVD